jgi:hypothetical protein
MFGCSAGARTWAECNSHVFDVPWQRQSTPRRSAPCPRAPRRTNPMPTPAPATIKTTPALTVHLRSLPTHPEHEFTGIRPAHGVPAAARALATVDQPLQPSSAPTHPSASFPGAQWSSPNPQTEHHLTGGAGLTPPDFNRPPSHVNCTTQYAILRFLAPRSSLTSIGASRAI